MEGKDVIEAKPSYMSEVHRALVVLGFSETERSVGVERNCAPQALKTFSSWIDRVQALPTADEQLCATWTEFMRARFGGSEPPMTPTAVNEAAHAARYAITMQLQLFPPRARRDYEVNQSYAAEWTELSAWREAAKVNGFDSPEDLSSVQGSTFGQFADKRIVKEWQKATGSDTPTLATMRIGSLRSANGDVLTQLQLSERKWQLATGCASPKDAESVRSAWCTATDCMFPAEAGDKIRALQQNVSSEWSEVEHWKMETGCLAATGAGELIKDLRTKSKAYDDLIEKSDKVHVPWLVADHERLANKAKELSAMLHERDQDLLTANTEIDRVKKAAQTLGLVSDHSAELAKVRAELQSKQRECQTEKERADRAESASNARGALLEKIREAMHNNSLPLIWDPLPGQVNDLRKRAETAESMPKVEQQKHDDTKKELLAANQKLASAIIPLPKPEKVEAGQRWARMYPIRDIRICVGSNQAQTSQGAEFGVHRMLESIDWLFLGS